HLRFTWDQWFDPMVPFHLIKETGTAGETRWLLARYRKDDKTVDLGVMKEGASETTTGNGDKKPKKPRPKEKKVARLAEPEPSAKAKVEAALKDLYKADYAKKRPADRLALSVKLYRQGMENTDNPAERFVMLREASSLAAEALNPEMALAALE